MQREVETVRNALAETASVVEEEFNALRAESSDSWAEIGSHLSRQASRLHSVQADVAAADERALRLHDESAAQISAVAQANGALSAEVNSLRASLGDQVADVREALHGVASNVRDAHTQIGLVALQATEDGEIARSIRAEVQSLAKDHDVIAAKVGANVASIDTVVGEVTGLGGEVAALKATVAQIAQVATDAQARAKAAEARAEAAEARVRALESGGPGVGSSWGGRSGGGEDSPVVAHLVAEMGLLREMVDGVRDEAATASSALAQDVHTLADEASSMKIGINSAMEAMYERLKSYVMSVEKQNSADVSKTSSSLAALESRVQEATTRASRQVDRALASLRESQAAFESSVRNDLDDLASESRKLASSVRIVETAVDDVASKSQSTANSLASVTGLVHHVEAEARALKSHSSLLESQILDHRSDLQGQMDAAKRESILRVDSLRSSMRTPGRGGSSRAREDDMMLSLFGGGGGGEDVVVGLGGDPHAFLNDL